MTEYETHVLSLIGKAMKGAMIDRKITVTQLEKQSGVSKMIIYKIFDGKNYEITSLIRVMRILQIHLELSLMSETKNIYTMGGDKPSMN